MKMKRKAPAVVLIVFACLSLTAATPKAPKPERGGWCCLCMCHSVDEFQCSTECIRMQNGKKIIEEPEMKSCTTSCQQKGVKQVFPQSTSH